MIQEIAWILSLFFMSVILLSFFFVYLSSKKNAVYEGIQVKGYKIRTYYFLTVLLIMIVVSILSLRHLPYQKPVDMPSHQAKAVQVVGQQFSWNMSEDTFKVGEVIEFDVTSKDVNHNFGLYDQNMKLIAQTQAMPGYMNRLYAKFDKPGKYKILCLEYCGVAHHVMVKEINVEA